MASIDVGPMLPGLLNALWLRADWIEYQKRKKMQGFFYRPVILATISSATPLGGSS